MSMGPSSASPGNEPLALSVSLLGAQQQPGGTSPAAAGSEPVVSMGGDSVQAANSLLRLIESMSSAPGRRDAAAEMTKSFAQEYGDCSVRCGLGRSRLNHLFDSRLGWLGPESSLHQQHSDQWATPDDDADDVPSDTPAVSCRGQVIEIRLPQPGGKGRCYIWIEGYQTEAKPITWTLMILNTIAAVLWSRPFQSWPSLVIGMCRHSMFSMSVAGSILVAVAILPVHYRVSCKARVDTTEQRFVSTPFEATLLKANVKPGDTVQRGDVLFELDGRPLRLEREEIEAEIQQVVKARDVALASQRIADAQQEAFKQQQLRRHHDLLSDRLGQLAVLSPIDGIVVSGDLQKFVGSPLERGRTLIEVAPMDKMIIEVEIPEYEIGYVEKGVKTRVKIDAIGGSSIRLPLGDIYPAAEVRDDRNVFIGRIHLDNTHMQLKPGMLGKATAYGPRRPWIWSWVRGALERVLWWVGY
jgi:multidrug efflux pump subunit AcrA (membrane-fusion protein)